MAHGRPADPTHPTPASVRNRPNAVAWVGAGVRAGLLGAAVVAAVLLVVDLASGRPLFTPAMLGSVLLTGDWLSPADFRATDHGALIVGYTAAHAGIFLGYGCCAAFFLLTAQGPMRSVANVAVATGAALFALFEVTFLAQALLFGPGLADELTGEWVALANALAAGAMGLFLALRSGPRAPRAREDMPKP